MDEQKMEGLTGITRQEAMAGLFGNNANLVKQDILGIYQDLNGDWYWFNRDTGEVHGKEVKAPKIKSKTKPIL